MAEIRLLRENSHLPADGWSIWVRAIVPDRETSRYYSPRSEGQPGMICTNIINNALPDEMKLCGIYEWKAIGTRDGQPNVVVYVGSTCRDKPGALRARIREYCRDGSHKEELMNEALENGYELWVRVKTTGRSRVTAENMENDLLEKYDYAWNERGNGEIRDIPPVGA